MRGGADGPLVQGPPDTGGAWASQASPKDVSSATARRWSLPAVLKARTVVVDMQAEENVTWKWGWSVAPAAAAAAAFGLRSSAPFALQSPSLCLMNGRDVRESERRGGRYGKAEWTRRTTHDGQSL